MRVKQYFINSILIIVFLFLLPFSAEAKLYINEFMASNASIVDDPDNEEYADWIEIYNSANVDINLNGYYLTDNISNPEKWQIKSDVTISAKDYLLIWADGTDNGLHTSFNLSKDGEEIGLFAPDLSLVDSLIYIYQSSDISFGRKPYAVNEWAYFTQPTPGASNSTTPYANRVEKFVEFSVKGGLLSEAFELELNNNQGGTIRYTTDGSVPTDFSLAYTSPIQVNKTSIIRARLFSQYMIPGPVVTHSYFFDESLIERGLPVVSIATDPDNFWDPEAGIYVQDFKPDWEVPINIEFFENNGSDRAAFNELAGTKVNGLYSWKLPQKMLGIYFRKQYDKNRLEYPLIHNSDRTSFKSFALRVSGSDWSYTFMRDGLLQTATQYNSDLDIQTIRPCIVFVNGEYLGLHNIREKVDDNYIVANYGFESGTFDLVENTEFAEAGDLVAYEEFSKLLSRDLSIKSNFDAVADVMDLENFTDYMSTELYTSNSSISHNVMAWKPKESGKWRWILMDLDRGFIGVDDNFIDYYANHSELPLESLLENENYKTYLGKRLSDKLYTTFNPIRIHKLIDEFKDRIKTEMPYQIERWLGTTSSYGDAIPSEDYWYDEIQVLKDFASQRPSYLLNDLQSYGFDSPVTLTLNVSPPSGGKIKFNDFMIPDANWWGDYPKNLEIILTAIDKPGYDFLGWAEASQQVIISKKSVWKYLDNGSDQGTAWSATGFNDASWQQGAAELGYGDGDEQTVVSYGGNSNNKYITTYFRKNINITASQANASSCLINLLRDDGAVVYVNGQEVVRSNMSAGSINFLSTAINSIGGTNESIYTSYSIDATLFQEGQNSIAVEIHQNSATSSDVSFDLELIFLMDNTSSFVSTNPEWTINLSNNRQLTAIYESNGQCIIPEVVETDLTLSIDCSPYVIQGDVTISPSATLTVEPGVQIYMAEKSNLFVNGTLNAIGTASQRISFILNPEHTGEWGAMCFHNTNEASELSYVSIEDASNGPDPSKDVAAISAFHADLLLDNIIIEDVFSNPIIAKYSTITLTNSKLHSKVTGDLINVKYGHASIENCEFRGNDQPDTDAIDYDEITDGSIKNCKIYDFQGFNSDAIDIGEQAENISISNILIYNISDKGISVGQKSSASISNCTFVNCNLGLGLKDSCHVSVNQCTFFGTNIPVSCYEKNPGHAGGNAIVRNSILSNSYDNSFYSDDRSSLKIDYSISDNDLLPGTHDNIFGDPLFNSPSFFDFELQNNSPCLSSGEYKGLAVHLGSDFYNYSATANLMFSKVFYNPANDEERSEFLSILNPSTENVDLFGYSVTLGIEYIFTEHIILQPNQEIFLVKEFLSPPSYTYPGYSREWTSGRLSNEGETIRLLNASGMVLDQIVYGPDFPWPNTSNVHSDVISLIDPSTDNHFGYHWRTVSYRAIVDLPEPDAAVFSLRVYPNPTQGIVTIKSSDPNNLEISIYRITGELLFSELLGGDQSIQLDLSGLENGMYLIKSGHRFQKIVLYR